MPTPLSLAMDQSSITELIYNHITAHIPRGDDHLLINLY